MWVSDEIVCYVVSCDGQWLVYVIEVYGSVFQATVADSFLADLDELSDNEEDILVSVVVIKVSP